MTKHISIRL